MELARLLPNAPQEKYKADAYVGELIPTAQVLRAWEDPVKHAITPKLREEAQKLVEKERKKRSQKRISG